MTKPNISVRVINIDKYVDKAFFSIFTINSYLSIETHFRFFISKLFEKYDKVLYLDSDMAALRDIGDLYAEDIGDNWWGVTYDTNIVVLGFSVDTWEYESFLPYVKNIGNYTLTHTL